MSVNKLGLSRTINASGRMSILGVSTLSDSVMEEMKLGAQNYFEMAELHKAAGKIIAEQLSTESAYVTNSASASIALSVAGVIAKNDPFIRKNIHDNSLEISREFILMKGHNVDYGAPVESMVQLGGGIVREAGYANGCTLDHIAATLTEKTAGFIYIKSHHCVQKNMPNLADIYTFCKNHQIPLIVDIAAEEEITAYSKHADLIILSGSKSLEGPTSGILAGKSEFVEYVKLHSSGIGRAMKVGKEAILGLLQALDEYGTKTLTKAEQLTILEQLLVLNNLTGVTVSITQDEAGREIYRGRIQIDEKVSTTNALEVIKALKSGETTVFTRDYNANIGYFEIDPRPLLPGDIEIIVQKLTTILGG